MRGHPKMPPLPFLEIVRGGPRILAISPLLRMESRRLSPCKSIA
jgi:hypothetical protein